MLNRYRGQARLPHFDRRRVGRLLVYGDTFQIRRWCRPQVAQHPLAVPVHEVDHTKLISLGVRPWLVRGGVDAALFLFGQATVLVHDDLPAMDDDDLRRGQPTTHKAFDEACAILAGDGLQSLAFSALLDPTLSSVNTEIRLRMVTALAVAVGPAGNGCAIDHRTRAHPQDLADR